MKVRFYLMLAVLIAGTPNLRADDASVENAEQTPPRTVTITISPETTYYTEPLLPDGRVDYYGAMHMHNSVGITPENNVAAGIFSIVPGEREFAYWYYPPEDEISQEKFDDYRQRYWQCLGFDTPPPALESLRFLSPRVQRGKELEYLLKYYTPEEIVARFYELQRPQEENVDLLEYLKEIQEGDRSWWLNSAVNHDWNQALDRFWTDEDFPLLADWNKTVHDLEQKLIEISKRPKFYNPVIAASAEDTFVYSALLPYVQGMREIGRFMSVRGNWHFARGEYDEAFECAFASRRVGLTIRTNNTFAVEDLVGIAICNVGNDRIMTYLMELDGRKDAKWLAAKRAEYAADRATYSIPDVPKWINWERCGMLSAIQMIAVNREKAVKEMAKELLENEGVVAPARQVFQLLSDMDAEYDWDKILRLANEHFDELEDMLYLPGYARQQRAHDRLEKRLVAMGKELETRSPDDDPEQYMTDVAVGLLSPSISGPMKALTRVKFNDLVVDLTFALNMYRSEHGEYPETLEQLVPKYLDTVPVSPFSEKPIRYGKRDDILLISGNADHQLDGSDELVEQRIVQYYVNSSPERTVYIVPLGDGSVFDVIVLRY